MIFDRDFEYTYNSFGKEFGPQDLGNIAEFVKELAEEVRQNTLANGRDPMKKVVVHKCAGQGKFASNAALLMGAYMICEMGKSAIDVINCFRHGK